MRRFLPVLALLAAAPSQSDLKKPLLTSDLGGRELTFLTKANEHGVLMNFLADLAKTKGDSKSVRDLGGILATAQDGENSRFIQIAAGLGLHFKAQTPAAMKRLHAKLDPLTGPAFDTACLAELTVLTKEIVANYESGAKCQDAEIQAFAEQALPLAREKLSVLGKVSAVK